MQNGGGDGDKKSVGTKVQMGWAKKKEGHKAKKPFGGLSHKNWELGKTYLKKCKQGTLSKEKPGRLRGGKRKVKGGGKPRFPGEKRPCLPRQEAGQ